MKSNLKSITGLAAMALWAMAADAGAAQAKPAENKTSKPGVAAAPSAQSTTEAVIPQSVFRTPANASQGRNPFFPLSTRLSPVPPPPDKHDKDKPPSGPPLVLTLNGLSGPPKRTAILNGRTFEAGEQGEVRLPSGSKILIKCEEIKDKSAIFLVAGQRREFTMRED